MTLPNQLSVLRIILAPIFLYMFLSSDLTYKKISVVIYFIATITDWYDGWHARKFGVVTKTGIFLDPLADKILTSCAFVGFYFMDIMPLWMVVFIVARDIIITAMRSFSEVKGITLPTSYIAKIKTFVQMTYIFGILILILLSSVTNDLVTKFKIDDFLSSPYNLFLMIFVTLLTVYTGITYFFEKKKAELK